MSSQDDDDASSKLRIDPEENPRLAKALAKLSENLKEGEDPLYYDWRKSGEAGQENKLKSDGDEAASGYVAAKTLPPTVAHKTIEMQRVKIAPHLDPRNAPTQPRLKVGPDAGADRPAPIEESSAATSASPSAPSPSPSASAPVSTPPPDGSRTVGGRTARLSPGVAPPPDETPPPSARAHPGPPSDRTLGGRTARLKTVGEGAVPIEELGAGPSASIDDPVSDAGAGAIPKSPAPSSVAPAARPPSARPDAPGATGSKTERPWLGVAIVAAAVLIVAVIAITQMGKDGASTNAAGTSTARAPEPRTAAPSPSPAEAATAAATGAAATNAPEATAAASETASAAPTPPSAVATGAAPPGATASGAPGAPATKKPGTKPEGPKSKGSTGEIF